MLLLLSASIRIRFSRSQSPLEEIFLLQYHSPISVLKMHNLKWRKKYLPFCQKSQSSMVSHFSRLNPPLVYCSLVLYSVVLLSHGEAQVMAHNLRPGQLPLKCWASCSSQAVVTQNHQSCDSALKPLASPHDCLLSHKLLSSESLLSSSVCWTWLYQELL